MLDTRIAKYLKSEFCDRFVEAVALAMDQAADAKYEKLCAYCDEQGIDLPFDILALAEVYQFQVFEDFTNSLDRNFEKLIKSF